MIKFLVKKAKIIDSDKIKLFLQKNFKIHNLKFNNKYIKNSFNEGIWFLSKINEKIIGIIFLKIIKQDKRGELKHLLIEENYRGKGIGKALFNETIKFARKNRLRKVTGFVASSIPIRSLRKVVKSLNFKLEGILRDHYRKNEDVYVYSLLIEK